MMVIEMLRMILVIEMMIMNNNDDLAKIPEGRFASASFRCCTFPVDATSRTPGGANLGLIMMEREMVMAGMELAVTMMI